MDQIEVIDIQGEVTFYKLDPAMGVSTIGRNPNAEIPLPNAEVANVHAMLYHRDATCQLVLYAENAAQTTLNSAAVKPNLSCTLSDGDTIQIGNYLLVYFKDGWDEARADETRITVAQLVTTLTADEDDGEDGFVDEDEEDANAGKNKRRNTPLVSTGSDQPARLVHPWISARLYKSDVVERAGDKATFTLELTYEVAENAPPSTTLQVNWLRENRTPLNGVFDPGNIKDIKLKQGDTYATDLTIDLKRVTPGRYALLINISSEDYRISSVSRIEPLDAVLWVYPKDIGDTANPPNLQVHLLDPEVTAEATAETTPPAVFHATITNCGSKEAQCMISVEPVFPVRYHPDDQDEKEAKARSQWHASWKFDEIRSVNLHNGEARNIEIRLNLAKARDMVAGVYPFKVIVRSPAYPRSSCMAVGRLIVQHQTGFAVRDEELRTPMKVTFHRLSAYETFVIHNTGNHPTNFVVNATDRSGALDFTFLDINDPTATPRLSPTQYELKPNDTKTLRMQVKLREEARQFIAPALRIYDVTLTTTMLTDPPFAPVQSQGQVWAKPFWLVWEAVGVLAAVAGLVMSVFLLISWPREGDKLLISKRNSNPAAQSPALAPSLDNTIAISAIVETALVTWQPLTFGNWRWRLIAKPDNDDARVLQPSADEMTYADKPIITTTYVLSPNNQLTTWLVNQQALDGWRTVFRAITHTRQVTAGVAQPAPHVEISTTTPYIYFGDSGFITWTNKSRTTSLTLDVNGDQTVISADEVNRATARAIPFEKLTKQANVVKFFADNEFLQKQESQAITISVVPRINSLSVVPQSGKEGDKVRMAWDVSSRSQITLIIPLGFEPSGTQIKDSKGELELTVTDNVTRPRKLQVFLESFSTTQPLPNLVPEPVFTRAVEFVIQPKPALLPTVCGLPQFSLSVNQEILPGSPEAANLRLRWEIEPDPNAVVSDTLEINGPGVGTIQVGNKGDIPIPATQSGIYIMRVTRLGVPPLLCSTELKLLPPPPTATPVPPPPVINFFSVRAAKTEESANVSLDLAGSVNGSPLYTVLAGTRLIFSWEAVVPVDQVKFNFASVSASVPNPGNYELVPTGTAVQAFRLEAVKAGQISAQTIRIRVLERAPRAPFGLRLSGSSGKWALTWSYPSEARDQIRGFRIKRSLSNGEGLTQVAGEDTLAPSTLTWELAPGELENDIYRCGIYYYVVAVYTDANGDLAESSSPNDGSVYTGACANPTPVASTTPELPPDLNSASAPSAITPTPIP